MEQHRGRVGAASHALELLVDAAALAGNSAAPLDGLPKLTRVFELTTGAQSPEIRPIDLARIETLAGPQGTLYGASSQSGTLRYIVAKPDVSQFEANTGGGINNIDKGDTGWDVDGMVNIPLIQDKVAVRLVVGDVDQLAEAPHPGEPGRSDLQVGGRISGEIGRDVRLDRNEAGLGLVVDEQAPDLLERDRPDEVFDVDPAVANRAAVAIRLGRRIRGRDGIRSRPPTRSHSTAKWRRSAGLRASAASASW